MQSEALHEAQSEVQAGLDGEDQSDDQNWTLNAERQRDAETDPQASMSPAQRFDTSLTPQERVDRVEWGVEVPKEKTTTLVPVEGRE